MKKSEISVLLALFICLAVNCFTDTNNTASNIRANTLRLHIIADNDSPAAQNIKLQVKDRLQSTFDVLYGKADSIEKAVQITADNMDYIQRIAQDTLDKNRAGYIADCSIENFYFDTTYYDNFTMPRGEYTALTVRLGNAKGKNWWCVAYPGLCISTCARYNDDSSNTFIETDSCRIKFKTVELWENLKQKFNKTEKYENY